MHYTTAALQIKLILTSKLEATTCQYVHLKKYIFNEKNPNEALAVKCARRPKSYHTSGRAKLSSRGMINWNILV